MHQDEVSTCFGCREQIRYLKKDLSFVFSHNVLKQQNSTKLHLLVTFSQGVSLLYCLSLILIISSGLAVSRSSSREKKRSRIKGIPNFSKRLRGLGVSIRLCSLVGKFQSMYKDVTKVI